MRRFSTWHAAEAAPVTDANNEPDDLRNSPNGLTGGTPQQQQPPPPPPPTLVGRLSHRLTRLLQPARNPVLRPRGENQLGANETVEVEF